MSNTTYKKHPVLIGAGVVLLFFAVALTCRLIWEETSLTWQEGPQMIGFSLAHGYYAPLLLAPVLLSGWLLGGLCILVIDKVKKRSMNKLLVGIIGPSVVNLGIVSLPDMFWQWMFISHFAGSPHAADLMTYDAAQGDSFIVRGYLDRGVPVESKNYEGSTSAFTAAAGGSVEVLSLLSTRGADLSAINSYGDSPLKAAVDNRHEAAAQFLRAHGAKEINGTKEQRDAATKVIVDKQIEKERSWR
jgi:hypothetical protein